MKFVIYFALSVCMCGCSAARKDEEMMHKMPDFYMYGGDIESSELDVVRKCWKVESVKSDHGTEIIIVRVDPTIGTGPSFEGENAGVIGLASRSTLYDAGDFGPNSVAGAVLWKVEPTTTGSYKAISSIGLVTIWKSESAIVKKK